MQLFDRYPCRRQGIINLKNKTAIQGVIWRVTREWLILRNASYIEARDKKVSMDGEVLVPRNEILFVQLVGSS